MGEVRGHTRAQAVAGSTPARIDVGDVQSKAASHGDGDDRAFGLIDIPEEQRIDTLSYSPEREGSLAVIGGHRSGKSNMLEVLVTASTEANTVVVPSGLEEAWDVVCRELSALRHGDHTPRLLLFDDLDALLGSYPDEYAHALGDMVIALLREGARANKHLVVCARRMGPQLQSIITLCDSRLVLRLPDKNEHVLAGGNAADFDPQLQRGGGWWRGNRVQIALARSSDSGAEAVPALCDTESWRPWPGLVVVAAHPAEFVQRLADTGGARVRATVPALADWHLTQLDAQAATGAADLAITTAQRGSVVVADPETWQAQWVVLAALRKTMPLVFDGCGTADFRALSRLRALPPPIAPGSEAVWLLSPDGRVRRSVPPWAHAAASE